MSGYMHLHIYDNLLINSKLPDLLFYSESPPSFKPPLVLSPIPAGVVWVPLSVPTSIIQNDSVGPVSPIPEGVVWVPLSVPTSMSQYDSDGPVSPIPAGVVWVPLSVTTSIRQYDSVGPVSPIPAGVVWVPLSVPTSIIQYDSVGPVSPISAEKGTEKGRCRFLKCRAFLHFCIFPSRFPSQE